MQGRFCARKAAGGGTLWVRLMGSRSLEDTKQGTDVPRSPTNQASIAPGRPFSTTNDFRVTSGASGFVTNGTMR
jgi:hypothetical protein